MSLLSTLYTGYAQLQTMSPWALLLLKATLLLSGAWLLHFMTASANPRWRVFLWRGTAAGLIMLTIWTFGLPSFEIRVRPLPPTAMMMASSPVVDAAKRDAIAARQSGTLPMVWLDSAGATTADLRESVAVSFESAHPIRSPSVSWQMLFLGLWGLGVTLLVGRLGIGYLRLTRLLRCSQAAPHEIDVEARQIAGILGCQRGVQICVSGQFAVPFLFGLRRPVVVLPERMCDPTYRPRLPGILAHELAHVRSGDYGWNAVVQFVSILLWFHPLIWRISSVHRGACDAVCDAISALHLGDVRAYCRTLALVALEAARQLPTPGLAMARNCDVRRRIAVLNRKVFGSSLGCRSVAGFAFTGMLACALLASLRFALAAPPAGSHEGQDAESASQATERLPSETQIADGTDDTSESKTADSAKVSGPALMQAVYDSLAWISSAQSFHICSKYKGTHSEEEFRWQDKQPQRGPFGSSKLDPRPFCTRDEWAWDQTHVRYHNEHFFEGEPTFTQSTRIWDGSSAVDWSTSTDGQPTHYVLGNKLTPFFCDQMVTNMAQLPWGPGDAYDFWWLPTDVTKTRSGRCLAPEDFELTGVEEIDARRCWVVQSPAGHERRHIGVADGRLYRRTCFIVRPGKAGYDSFAISQKVGGASIKTPFHWEAWLQSLDPIERQNAFRKRLTAEFEFARPWLIQTYDDYREVAPGCWMAFRQSIDTYNVDAPEPFLASHSEQIVTKVAFNQPLPDELFHYELKDGVQVGTDWRYDPIIRYTYRKDQTEAERVALCEAERAKIAEGQAELKKRQAVIESRMGEAPPPLPKSGWLNSDPLSWEQLRGKVVVLHFWDVNCGPCLNELPFMAMWHDSPDKNGVVEIGIHRPTDDVAAVREKLAEFGAKYPVLIDSAAKVPNGLGLMHDWFGISWWPHTALVDRDGRLGGHGRLWMGDIHEQVLRLSIAGLSPKAATAEAAAHEPTFNSSPQPISK
jgi:beta-lactamase regulating signal transducer with metallopeptidase domain